MQNTVAPAISTAVDAAQKAAAIHNTEAQTNQINISSAENLAKLKLENDVLRPKAATAEAENTILYKTLEERIKQIASESQNAAENVRETRARATLKEADIPAAQNKAATDKNLYGKHVRPYINDAKALKNLID